MTHPSVNGDNQITNKKMKSHTPGGPAQLARSMPHAYPTLSDRVPVKCKVCPWRFHKHQKSKAIAHKSNPMPQLISLQQVKSIG